jgi:hypothetical protein
LSSTDEAGSFARAPAAATCWKHPLTPLIARYPRMIGIPMFTVPTLLLRANLSSEVSFVRAASRLI